MKREQFWQANEQREEKSSASTRQRNSNQKRKVDVDQELALQLKGTSSCKSTAPVPERGVAGGLLAEHDLTARVLAVHGASGLHARAAGFVGAQRPMSSNTKT